MVATARVIQVLPIEHAIAGVLPQVAEKTKDATSEATDYIAK